MWVHYTCYQKLFGESRGVTLYTNPPLHVYLYEDLNRRNAFHKRRVFVSETQVCLFAAETCSQMLYSHMSSAAFSASLILERNLLSCLQPATILVKESEE